MQLFYREYGTSGPWIIIIHGLYGSSDNWLSISKALEQNYRIIAVDQRNHGRSPHNMEHNYTVMADDIYQIIIEKNIDKPILIGHSMGGKTAMQYALSHPERIDKLVVLDIAPKSYNSLSNYSVPTNNHPQIIDTMLNIDLSKISKRADISEKLMKAFNDVGLVNFLQKNVERLKDGNYQWRLNLLALKNNLTEILDGFSNQSNSHCNVETIFIRGEKSSYLLDEDMQQCRDLFSKVQFASIPDAGHWLHAEQPELLLKTLNYFLTI